MTDDRQGDLRRDLERDHDKDRERDRDRDRDRDRERERAKARQKLAVLKIFERLLPIITLVVGAGWALYQYIDHQREVEHQTRSQAVQSQNALSFAARKPFLDKQLELYVEVSKIAGYLISHKPTEPQWHETLQRFESMYWTEVSLVQSANVGKVMQELKNALDEYLHKPDDESVRLSAAIVAQHLAIEIRDDLNNAWRKPTN